MVGFASHQALKYAGLINQSPGRDSPPGWLSLGAGLPRPVSVPLYVLASALATPLPPAHGLPDGHRCRRDGRRIPRLCDQSSCQCSIRVVPYTAALAAPRADSESWRFHGRAEYHCYRARLDVTAGHAALPAWPADAHAYSAGLENSLATSPEHYTQSRHALPESPVSRGVLLGHWGVSFDSPSEQRRHFLPDMLLHGQRVCRGIYTPEVREVHRVKDRGHALEVV